MTGSGEAAGSADGAGMVGAGGDQFSRVLGRPQRQRGWGRHKGRAKTRTKKSRGDNVALVNRRDRA